MNLDEYKYFIIVDKNGRAMSYTKGNCQVCYCDATYPVKIYLKDEAKKIIKRSKEFRRKKGFSINEYYLIPVFSDIYF